MKSTRKKSIKKTTAKLLFAGVLSFGIMGFTSAAFAQGPPTPPGGPGGPPPPGELLKKINPFKKNKNKSADNALNLPAPGTPPAGAPGNPPKLGNRPAAPGNGPGTPPTPPNPIEALKKSSCQSHRHTRVLSKIIVDKPPSTVLIGTVDTVILVC